MRQDGCLKGRPGSRESRRSKEYSGRFELTGKFKIQEQLDSMREKSDIIHVPESVPTLRMKELTREKKALYGLITVLLGISAGAVLAEFGLRISGPKWLIEQMNGTNLEGALRYGSDAGWPVETMNRKFIRFKPNQQFPVDYYEYHTVVHTDQWGGRASEHSQENEGFLVPVMGDSFAFGLGVKDEETFISLFNIRKE